MAMPNKYSLLFTFLCLFLLVFGLWNVKTEETFKPKPIHVLCYHDITPNSSFKYSRTPERLKSDFQLLKDKGFKVIPLEKIIEAGQKKVALSQREAAITFDDATQGQYQYARLLLKSFGYPATFYAPTALVESGEPAAREYSGTMAWADIRKLAEEGFYMASHGHSHKDLSRLSPVDLKEEIRTSLSLLRERAGMKNGEGPFKLMRRFPASGQWSPEGRFYKKYWGTFSSFVGDVYLFKQ